MVGPSEAARISVVVEVVPPAAAGANCGQRPLNVLNLSRHSIPDSAIGILQKERVCMCRPEHNVRWHATCLYHRGYDVFSLCAWCKY